MIATESNDFHTFADIRFFRTLSKKKYNFSAKSGIPIIRTGLYRLFRICCFYSGFLPCVFFV